METIDLQLYREKKLPEIKNLTLESLWPAAGLKADDAL
jgi:hypothetical protein